MKISLLSKNTAFKQYIVIGKDSDNYKTILKPYDKILNRITDGFDVVIREEKGPFHVYDDLMDEYHNIYDIPVVSIKPDGNARRIITELKMYVYPGAGEMQTKGAQAREMVRVIKKGISIYA
ncbi:MAG: hypothetical protein K6A44_00320 [bacterium]|nr:hypothetical protein [bacterium]